MGIKETMEVLNALDAVVDFVARSMADGKIDLKDMIGLVPMFGVLKDAFVGGQLVVAELRDGTAEEWQVIATKAIAIIQKVGSMVLKAAA